MSTTDAAPETGPKPSDDQPSELENQIEQWARVALPVGTVALAGAAGWVQGPGAAILVLAGGALVGGIAVFWSSLRTLFGETPLSGADAYAIGAPRTEEEQKRAVLRALKDLEFEHGVGKISEEDYQALVAQYRAEAKRLLRLLDDDAKPRRTEVEALVAKRLRKEGLLDTEDATTKDEARAAREAVAKRTASTPPPGASAGKPLRPKKKAGKADGPTCAKCGTTNDADAAFCKKCGARQGAKDEGPADEPAAKVADDAAKAATTDDDAEVKGSPEAEAKTAAATDEDGDDDALEGEAVHK
jgi:hypothetical protein